MTMCYFEARLQCLNCQKVSERASIVTGLDLDAGSVTRVGDSLDMSFEQLGLTHLPLHGHSTHSRDELRFLELWNCPHCGASNWVEVTLAHSTIKALVAVPLSQKTFRNSQFISDDIHETYLDIVGEQMYANGKYLTDWQARLMAHLPAEVTSRND